MGSSCVYFFFFQAEDGIRDGTVTGVQTCALPISGATALGSSPEMTMAPTCCSVRVVMNGTCAAAFAEDGPTCWNFPLRAVAASLPPEAAVSKYGLLICLGRNTMLRLLPVPVPLVGVLPPVVVLPPPQAASNSSTHTRKPGPSV